MKVFLVFFLLSCGKKKKPNTVIPASEVTTSPSETKGVLSVETLGQISLNTEFEGFEVPTLMRLRRLTIDGGGSVAVHEHNNRPGIAYILSGEITEHRNGVDRLCQTGEIAFEQSGVTHGWENRSSTETLAVVVDLLQPDPFPELETYSSIMDFEGSPSESMALSVKGLGDVDLSAEFTPLSGYVLRARQIEVAPSGVVGFHQHLSRPSFAYLLKGEMIEHRDDRKEPIIHQVGSVVTEQNGLGHWWENETEENALFLVVDIVKKMD